MYTKCATITEKQEIHISKLMLKYFATFNSVHKNLVQEKVRGSVFLQIIIKSWNL